MVVALGLTAAFGGADLKTITKEDLAALDKGISLTHDPAARQHLLSQREMWT